MALYVQIPTIIRAEMLARGWQPTGEYIQDIGITYYRSDKGWALGFDYSTSRYVVRR